MLPKALSLYSWGGTLRGLTMESESLTPAVGGPGVVASGFGLTTGASDGCGGGVARCMSSRKMYVPVGCHEDKHVRHVIQKARTGHRTANLRLRPADTQGQLDD